MYTYSCITAIQQYDIIVQHISHNTTEIPLTEKKILVLLTIPESSSSCVNGPS